jgi:hypothetical protein
MAKWILLAAATVCIPVGEGMYSCTGDDGQPYIVYCQDVGGTVLCTRE